MSRGERPKRRWAFAAVSTGLQVGHALVAATAVGMGLLILLQESPARMNLGKWSNILLGVVVVIPCIHLLLMMVTPVWSALAARTQTQVSRLWAWLGYFIPLAGYWLPAQTLRELAEGAGPDSARLRTLILAWGIARGLAAPSAMAAGLYAIYKAGMPGNTPAATIVTYGLVTISAANLLSLFMIGQMRRHLSANAIDERHAEVFA